MSGFLRTYADPAFSLQQPFDAAVVIPTVLRPELRHAVESVFSQDIQGRFHVLIGIDAPRGDLSMLESLCSCRPSNCAVQVYYPGYSTSTRHGGLSPAGSGGVLRCVLSHLANSPHIAYLDDDNWWREDHLRLLLSAISAADWAFSLRWFVHPSTDRPICVDLWESVGPGSGLFRERFGGFVDPNCLMINKLRCQSVLEQWNSPLAGDPKGMSEDRNVFNVLLRHQLRAAATNQPTAFYRLNPADGMHPIRCKLMGSAYEIAGTNSPSSMVGSL